MVTSTSPYLASKGRSSSSTCRQLRQQKVQKSSSTILPRSPARVRGSPPVFSQPRPRSSGARTRTRDVLDMVRPSYEGRSLGLVVTPGGHPGLAAHQVDLHERGADQTAGEGLHRRRVAAGQVD